MTKLRIKVGSVEVECEGSDDFLRKELPALLKTVFDLRGTAPEGPPSEASGAGDVGQRTKRVTSSLSTSTIAAKTGSRSGSDLALAAAAALVIGEGKESFSRAELLKAMKSAKSYYRATYNNNLSKSLSKLVKDQALLDHGNDSFGLHDGKRTDLEKKLDLG